MNVNRKLGRVRIYEATILIGATPCTACSRTLWRPSHEWGQPHLAVGSSRTTAVHFVWLRKSQSISNSTEDGGRLVDALRHFFRIWVDKVGTGMSELHDHDGREQGAHLEVQPPRPMRAG